MSKVLSQNNYLNISKFKIDLKRNSVKFELTLLIFNNNEIVKIININFNVLKFNVLNLKIYEIKNVIFNFYLISFLIRYNVFKSSSLNLIISFQILNLFVSFLNNSISSFIIKIVQT